MCGSVGRLWDSKRRVCVLLAMTSLFALVLIIVLPMIAMRTPEEAAVWYK